MLWRRLSIISSTGNLACVPASFHCAEDLQRSVQARRPNAPTARCLCYQFAFALHAHRETDNCANALWLLSFAWVSWLLRCAFSCFPRLAKNIPSGSCQTFSGSSRIRQKNGRRHQKRVLTSLPLVLTPLNLHKKLVRQKITWLETSI